jgi:hypothetical protein
MCDGVCEATHIRFSTWALDQTLVAEGQLPHQDKGCLFFTATILLERNKRKRGTEDIDATEDIFAR